MSQKRGSLHTLLTAGFRVLSYLAWLAYLFVRLILDLLVGFVKGAMAASEAADKRHGDSPDDPYKGRQ